MIGLIPSILAGIVTLLIIASCIIWAPFAAFICARIARMRGLNVKRHAVHGAIYSVLLFVPWRHLIRQMRGEPISPENIKEAYIIAYVLAALVLASQIAFILAYPYPRYSIYAINTIIEFIVTSTISIPMLTIGLISMTHANKFFNQQREQQKTCNTTALPNKPYIVPFAWAWASMLICSAPWLFIFI